MREVMRVAACVGLGMLLVAGPARAAEAVEFTHLRDVIYGRRAGLALTMDVLTPKKNANGLGLIFVISGGWMSDRGSITPAAYQTFLRRGYTVFTVVHGSQPTFTAPDMVEDVHRAVRFIRYHAADYHVDPDRLGISGASSGGHLALMAALNNDHNWTLRAQDEADRIAGRVRAVACFFPPTDFFNWGRPFFVLDSHTLKPPFTGALQFKRLDPATGTLVPVTDVAVMHGILHKISPIAHVTPDAPPTLLIHGDADVVVPLQQSQSLIARLREAGVPARLVVKEGCGHGWPGLLKDAELEADWFDRYLKDQR